MNTKNTFLREDDFSLWLFSTSLPCPYLESMVYSMYHDGKANQNAVTSLYSASVFLIIEAI